MTDKKKKEYCSLVAKQPLKPRLQCVANTPGDSSFSCDDLLDIDKITARRLVDCSLADYVRRDLSLEQSICEKVSFTASRLPLMTTRDVRFLRCDMANARWIRSFWDRVEIVGCRLTGFDVTQAIMKDIIIRDCQADFACFRFATFKKTVCFEGCSLKEANFQGADLRGVSFRNCDLREAEMSQAKLLGADIRDSKIEGIKVAPEALRGVVVDVMQAAYLAGLLGLIVR
jgi:uncharacterized protein YjbI with pentapeptide repeats